MAPLWGPPSPTLLARVATGQVGGIILLGHGWSSSTRTAAALARLQSVACAHGGEPLLVGVDQEGGTVRRFQWAAPSVSAAQMTGAQAEGAATAHALRSVGVGIDFAPVADVVATPASFLGTRSFGSDPAVVASQVTAFVTGLQRGGVAATAKHFPGLGSATVSTDDRRVTIGRSAAFLTARLQPFRAAIAAGAQLVMVSSASYPALDPTGTPALFSRSIVTGLLRDQLGFGGVVLTDAIDAPAPAATPHAPARAIAAGVDLLLYTTTGASERGYVSLLHDAAASATLRAQIATSGARLRALKAWLAARGGPTCS
ncbi:MAG TPA: glycoside hydrolase family 3 N-terminal domain-containing protein [Gaiellaceae bacterium]|nr:glycoside hydrolase family 3 N-terminal domain-containing protein [Gaiellaceae bacterium]